MKITQINGLNKMARTYLLGNLVSKKGAEVMLFGFNGYINGMEVEDLTLIRNNSKWEVFSTSQKIMSISGKADLFSLTR
jgi:hypothetical protein